MDENADTIAAIATAHGAAGIGVVRVSGPLAPVIAATVLGRTPQPRHAYFAPVRDAAGQLLDHGVVLYFPAPHSYTGEAVLELQVHGGNVSLDLVLKRVCGLGARLARPGEFSERAYVNGKLDLAQAEAVADLVAARSEAAARAAMRSLQGEFSTRVNALLAALVGVRVHVEAAIDFPDEEIDFLADPAIGRSLRAVQDDMRTLLEAARRGQRLCDGLNVVIVGRPNVGKSSLLNALVGSDRAIVTATAGTTRDVLRETLEIDGVALELVDTAGLRESTDEIEREGVRRARERLQEADLVLAVTDVTDTDPALLAELPPRVQRMMIINKIDLHGGHAHAEERDGATWLWLSAKTGEGLALLRRRLKDLGGGDAHVEGGAFSARRRHVLALERTAAHLDAARRALEDVRAGELAAEDLRQAQQALGEITGEFCPDDLLGAIFSTFCIGK